MSGAPVVAAGRLLGVVTEHAPREGPSAITAVPLTALEPDPAHPGWGPGVKDPSAWWARLGVTRPCRPAAAAGCRQSGRSRPIGRRCASSAGPCTGGCRSCFGRERELAEIAAFATGRRRVSVAGRWGVCRQDRVAVRGGHRRAARRGGCGLLLPVPSGLRRRQQPVPRRGRAPAGLPVRAGSPGRGPGPVLCAVGAGGRAGRRDWPAAAAGRRRPGRGHPADRVAERGQPAADAGGRAGARAGGQPSAPGAAGRCAGRTSADVSRASGGPQAVRGCREAGRAGAAGDRRPDPRRRRRHSPWTCWGS